MLNVELASPNKFETLFIRNIQGKLILNQKITTGGKIQLEISHLVSGIYFIEAKGKSKKKIAKFIKM